MKVYKLENKINGKIYIGMTGKTIETRVKEHSGNQVSVIGNAIRKYGLNNFSISCLESVDSRDEAAKKEQFWISFYNCQSPNGYNLTKGGDGIQSPSPELRVKMGIKNRGRKITPEQSARLSASLRKWYSENEVSEETRNKISTSKLGGDTSTPAGKLSRSLKLQGIKFGPRSDEVKAKISIANSGDKNASKRPEVRKKISDSLKGNTPWNKGRTLSEEHRRKLSESHKGKVQSEETKLKRSASLKGHPNWTHNMTNDPRTGHFIRKDLIV